MYKMPEFTEDNKQAVLDFMYEHPFVVLTGCHNNIPVATQVPVLIHEHEGKIVLRGHIMRKTDHQIAFEANPHVLVLFNGPQCYVSASWYNERNIGSTWNYMTVHARGIMRFMDDEATLQLIKDLTHKYEDSQLKPELVEYMSLKNYVMPMVKAIVSFELTLDWIYPLFKISQNRNAESHANIIKQLKLRGDYNSLEIAKEMEKRVPQS
ncbi:MAG: FMN-binding negative transcriptional regulator [Bacteroidetes bacterium]|nr:FMN-binding negative transcriptional regulator [Bacteroidota bacterium]